MAVHMISLHFIDHCQEFDCMVGWISSRVEWGKMDPPLFSKNLEENHGDAL